MNDLTIRAGSWWTMDGQQPEHDLVISPEGPPLQAARSDRVVLTGWRHLEDQPKAWVTVQVRRDSGGWNSGPCWPWPTNGNDTLGGGETT